MCIRDRSSAVSSEASPPADSNSGKLKYGKGKSSIHENVSSSGQNMSGGVLSNTITDILQVAVLPDKSVAVHVITVVPTG